MKSIELLSAEAASANEGSKRRAFTEGNRHPASTQQAGTRSPQEEAPDMDVDRPGSHVSQTRAPAAAYRPGAHSVQRSLASTRPAPHSPMRSSIG
jgi:hypothetical protein